MDILDFVPFLGFIRNDEETISIMAEASVVIPQVCDILGISLSDSEGDEELEESRRRQRRLRSSSESSLSSSPLPLPPPPSSSSSSSSSSASFSNNSMENDEEDDDEEEEEEEENEDDGVEILESPRRRRRRRESSTSSLLQALFSTSSPSTRNHAKDDLRSLLPRKRVNSQGSDDGIVDPDNPNNGQSASPTAAYTSDLVLPPRKRRICVRSSSLSSTTSSHGPDPTNNISSYSSSLPSISPVSTSTTFDFENDPIRQQLRQDVDSFNDKIRQLAALERQKNQLLETLLSISSTITQETETGDGQGDTLMEENPDQNGHHQQQSPESSSELLDETISDEDLDDEDDDDLDDDDDDDLDISEISDEDEDDDIDDEDVISEDNEDVLGGHVEVEEEEGEVIYEAREEEIETTEVVEEQIVTLDSYELLQSP